METLNYEYPLDRDPKFLTGGFDKYFGDPTWKERHAKGVPATADTSEQQRSWRDLTDYSQRHATNLWHICPYIRNMEYPGRNTHHPMVWAGYMDEEGDFVIMATFCNFRYKQSWLDKKKSCSFPDCGADPDEGPYCCKSRLDKKGGERV